MTAGKKFNTYLITDLERNTVYNEFCLHEIFNIPQDKGDRIEGKQNFLFPKG